MSFLRINTSKEKQVSTAVSTGRVVFKPVENVVTHIVRRYASGGRIVLPRTSGGRAFLKALQERGIQARLA